jgi:hypothetical protein
MPNRRFPPPWSDEDIGAAFKVCDSNGQALAYVYMRMSRGEDRWRSCSPKMRREGCGQRREATEATEKVLNSLDTDASPQKNRLKGGRNANEEI